VQFLGFPGDAQMQPPTLNIGGDTFGVEFVDHELDGWIAFDKAGDALWNEGVIEDGARTDPQLASYIEGRHLQ
jgi:hypothetical protein